MKNERIYYAFVPIKEKLFHDSATLATDHGSRVGYQTKKLPIYVDHSKADSKASNLIQIDGSMKLMGFSFSGSLNV